MLKVRKKMPSFYDIGRTLTASTLGVSLNAVVAAGGASYVVSASLASAAALGQRCESTASRFIRRTTATSQCGSRRKA